MDVDLLACGLADSEHSPLSSQGGQRYPGGVPTLHTWYVRIYHTAAGYACYTNSHQSLASGNSADVCYDQGQDQWSLSRHLLPSDRDNRFFTPRRHARVTDTCTVKGSNGPMTGTN